MAAPDGPGLNLPDPGVHLPYNVLSQQSREELTPDNRFITIWEISYEGPSGTVASVKVPDAEHDAAAIDRAIQAQLHTVEAVHALGAVPHPENLQQ